MGAAQGPRISRRPRSQGSTRQPIVVEWRLKGRCTSAPRCLSLGKHRTASSRRRNCVLTPSPHRWSALRAHRTWQDPRAARPPIAPKLRPPSRSAPTQHGLWDILSDCSGATAAKLMLATLLETATNRLPSQKLWNVVYDISAHVAGSGRSRQVATCRSRQEVQCAHRRERNAQVGPSATAAAAWSRRRENGAQHWRRSSVGSRRRATVVKSRLARAAKRTGPRDFSGRLERTLAISPPAVPMQVCCGVRKFWASHLLSSKP